MHTDPYIQFAMMPSLAQIIIILLIVLLLFGAKRIPDLMKGLGKGIKEYKKAVKGIEDELSDDAPDGTESKDKD
ncbi:MAG: twin-arginine translocase TatA/TatE family subunit [Bacteroidales bacterium]|nr:twin-arginine translocase TatA/TatE family subunit [Bacteroidales bacterium]